MDAFILMARMELVDIRFVKSDGKNLSIYLITTFIFMYLAPRGALQSDPYPTLSFLASHFFTLPIKED